MEEKPLTNRLQAARQKSDHHHGINIEKIEDPNFDRKLDLITAGARPFVREHLLTKITRENCQTLIAYILAMQTEVSPSQSYREGTINRLKRFAEFHNPKSFRDITRQDVIDFLDSLRKPESIDPLHQWKGTHEVTRITLIRFFRWLYHPDIAPKKRPKPAVMENIPKLDRKEESIYKPTDRWTKKKTLYFKDIVLLFGTGVTTQLLEILVAGVKRCLI